MGKRSWLLLIGFALPLLLPQSGLALSSSLFEQTYSSSPSTSTNPSAFRSTVRSTVDPTNASPNPYLLWPGRTPAQLQDQPDTGQYRSTPLRSREASAPEEPPDLTAGPPPLRKHETSTIEQAFAGGDAGIETATSLTLPEMQLHQFGYDFFQPGVGAAVPLTDVPVGPDYVLGPGDTIVLSVWGSLDGSYPLQVNRSGEIVLPRVGAISVWGVTFERLPALIRSSLARVFKNFELNVTMGKLRVIRVYVVGEVRQPGDYSLNSLSTVINALAAAGGPAKTGTLRNIQVRRGGKVAGTLDLYDFLIRGDQSADLRLQSGDTVFVPPIGPVAGITGTVIRPAIYELKGEKTLWELLEFAGGLLSTGHLQRVQISRVKAHERREVEDVRLDPADAARSLATQADAVTIRDQDMVRIFTIDRTLRGYVRLEGHVLRPGDYALKPGMRVSDLLPRTDLLPEHYEQSAELTRFVPPDFQPEKIFFNLGAALAGDPQQNPELREFDRIRIFSRWEMEEMPMVRISGEVQQSGEYRLFKGMTVRDLLVAAGNPKRTAYLSNAEISRLRREGNQVTSFPMIINLGEALRGNPEHNLTLQPYDQLTVRRIPNWAEETERYATVSGEVLFPGVYPIYKGEKLSSLIERAGGFTNKSYLRGARFTRESIRKEQQKRMDEMIARTQLEILKRQGELASLAASKEELEATKASLEGLQRSLDLLKQVPAEGRMVLRLFDLPLFKGSDFDIEMQGGDVLDVPPTPNSVMVMGQVYNPTTFIHLPGEDVGYYLQQAGGATRDAEEDEIYVVRADGTVNSRQQGSFGFNWSEARKKWTFGGFMSSPLEPGDTLVVPQRLERIAWMREIKDIAVILGQLALAAGVIIAAGN